MANRVWLTNVLLIAGAALLIAAIFLPVVCFFAMAGGTFVGGCTSFWGISPLLSSVMIFVVTTAASTAMWHPNDELSSALLTTGLFLAVVSAAGIALLLIEILLIHPYPLAAVIAASGVFVAAAFVAKKPGQSMRFRFHLRTLLLCVTMAGLFLGALATV
jgi:hypothetical protein